MNHATVPITDMNGRWDAGYHVGLAHFLKHGYQPGALSETGVLRKMPYASALRALLVIDRMLAAGDVHALSALLNHAHFPAERNVTVRERLGTLLCAICCHTRLDLSTQLPRETGAFYDVMVQATADPNLAHWQKTEPLLMAYTARLNKHREKLQATIDLLHT